MDLIRGIKSPENGFDLAVGKGVAQPVGVIAPVGQQHSGGGHGSWQGGSARIVADLACREKQGSGPPLAVADRVEFRVQPALGASDMPGQRA
jgi:hypothetical protein